MSFQVWLRTIRTKYSTVPKISLENSISTTCTIRIVASTKTILHGLVQQRRHNQERFQIVHVLLVSIQYYLNRLRVAFRTLATVCWYINGRYSGMDGAFQLVVAKIMRAS